MMELLFVEEVQCCTMIEEAASKLLQCGKKKRKFVVEQSNNEAAKAEKTNNDAGECIRRILEHLNIKEACQFGSCNKFLWASYEKELTKRKQRWINGTSKSWNINVEYNQTKFADDYAWDLAKSGLDVVFHPCTSKETRFFDTIATWSSGGWGRFLYTREVLGPLPTQFQNGGRIMQLSTPGNASSCKPVVICDIRCDGKCMWSGIHPIRQADIARMCIEVDDGEFKSITAIYPESTKTIGDATDLEATIHTLDHGYRPNKYLLSTNPNDKRLWSFSLSIVSPSCSETLISKTDFRPREVMSQLKDTWIPYSGVGTSPRHPDFSLQQSGCDCIFQATNDDKKAIICQSRADLYRGLLEGETINCPGIDDKGNLVSYFSEVDCHFHWDRRRQQRQEDAAANNSNALDYDSIDGRLHMTLSIFLEDDLIHNMICNPPPQP